jgi:hypothetical protein
MATLAEVLRQAGYVTPQGQVVGPRTTTAQTMSNYIRNIISNAAQNLAQQRSDIDAALTMGDQGIQVGDRAAFERQMAQVPNLMGLTAYHGTPHTIKGKFDISKVGTGEGAQAYGHGMYFAENPAVATQYRNILSKPEFTKTAEGVELRGQLPRMLDESYSELVAKNGIQQTNYGDVVDVVSQRLDRQMKDALKANDMDWYSKTADMKIDLARFRENPPPNTGNLYKVDIPDEYIPNMLDWDKPLKEQPNIVEMLKTSKNKDIQKMIANLDSFANSNTPPTGQNLLKTLGYYPDNPKKASKILDSLGIKGVRYLDEGSRGTNKGTSNFVVFDPAEVKILEQNSKPLSRKEIIEQELEKVSK